MQRGPIGGVRSQHRTHSSQDDGADEFLLQTPTPAVYKHVDLSNATTLPRRLLFVAGLSCVALLALLGLLAFTWVRSCQSSNETPLHTNDRTIPRQSHTAVCINFNRPPYNTSLLAVLDLHTRLHAYLTIISPSNRSSLTVPLPPSVNFLHCPQFAVLDKPLTPLEQGVGFNGELQHLCSALCFDYYRHADLPVRGVLYQSDDMYVNYTTMFNTAHPRFDPANAWSPTTARGHPPDDDYIASRGATWHYREPVASLYHWRHTLAAFNSSQRYRTAWQLVLPVDPLTPATTAIADIFYLPLSQLAYFVELVRFISSDDVADQWITLPDHRSGKVNTNGRQLRLRRGMIASEVIIATLLLLTAALHRMDHPSAHSTARPAVTGLPGQVMLWDADRSNQTLLRDLVFQRGGVEVVTVHPVKLSDMWCRALMYEAYRLEPP